MVKSCIFCDPQFPYVPNGNLMIVASYGCVELNTTKYSVPCLAYTESAQKAFTIIIK